MIKKIYININKILKFNKNKFVKMETVQLLNCKECKGKLNTDNQPIDEIVYQAK